MTQCTDTNGPIQVLITRQQSPRIDQKPNSRYWNVNQIDTCDCIITDGSLISGLVSSLLAASRYCHLSSCEKVPKLPNHHDSSCFITRYCLVYFSCPSLPIKPDMCTGLQTVVLRLFFRGQRMAPNVKAVEDLNEVPGRCW
jgi:hypothetical protein